MFPKIMMVADNLTAYNITNIDKCCEDDSECRLHFIFPFSYSSVNTIKKRKMI